MPEYTKRQAWEDTVIAAALDAERGKSEGLDAIVEMLMEYERASDMVRSITPDGLVANVQCLLDRVTNQAE